VPCCLNYFINTSWEKIQPHIYPILVNINVLMLRVRVTDILPSVIQKLGVKHYKRK